MDIDLGKIEEIYGVDILNLVKENIDDINKNIKYLIYLNFEDVENIFERYTPVFICNFIEFKNKIDKLINKLGKNYVSIIENDLGILEELLWSGNIL